MHGKGINESQTSIITHNDKLPPSVTDNENLTRVDLLGHGENVQVVIRCALKREHGRNNTSEIPLEQKPCRDCNLGFVMLFGSGWCPHVSNAVTSPPSSKSWWHSSAPCTVPYTLSNLGFVTQSISLIADSGKEHNDLCNYLFQPQDTVPTQSFTLTAGKSKSTLVTTRHWQQLTNGIKSLCQLEDTVQVLALGLRHRNLHVDAGKEHSPLSPSLST